MAEICGAKTRAGGRCRKLPAKGSKRCKLHGGKSTGPKDQTENTNAVAHGFYSDALLPEERPLYERAEIGSLDDEIRLAKVKLFRFVKLANSADLAGMIDGAIDVVKKVGSDPAFGAYDRNEIKAAAPNYAELIIKQLDVIRKLELARRELNKKDTEDASKDDGPVTEMVIRVVRPGDL